MENHDANRQEIHRNTVFACLCPFFKFGFEDADDLSRGVESAMIYAEARAKGDEMADAAKKDGKDVEDQVAAAAQGAMDSMNGEHAQVSDVVSAAYKSAKETGLEEGLSDPAAQTAAVAAIRDELSKGGMSSTEARHMNRFSMFFIYLCLALAPNSHTCYSHCNMDKNYFV